jgi:hypothetical protein
MIPVLILARATRQRSLALIVEPVRWPLWPLLPLRRVISSGVELGLLYDARGAQDLYGYSATVFLTNMFEMPDDDAEFLNLPRHVYDSFEELLDAGWRVD